MTTPDAMICDGTKRCDANVCDCIGGPVSANPAGDDGLYEADPRLSLLPPSDAVAPKTLEAAMPLE
jgi:hypothetical protein